MSEEIRVVGKRGTVVIPARVRRRLGLLPGAKVLFQDDGRAVVLKRAKVVVVTDDDEEMQDRYDVERIEGRGKMPKNLSERSKGRPWSAVKKDLGIK